MGAGGAATGNPFDMIIGHVLQRIVEGASNPLNTCMKSQTLFIMYLFALDPEKLMPHILMLITQNLGGKQGLARILHAMLLSYRNNMEMAVSSSLKKSNILTIQTAGLTSLLSYTVKDLEFAALRLPNGLKFQDPCPQTDSLPLQSLLVCDLSQFLAKTLDKPVKESEEGG